MTLLSTSKMVNGVYYDGMVQDPTKDQFTWPIHVHMDGDTLVLRGYSMFSFLGANVYWKRISEQKAYQGCLHTYSSEKEVLANMSESEALRLGNQGQLCYKGENWQEKNRKTF